MDSQLHLLNNEVCLLPCMFDSLLADVNDSLLRAANCGYESCRYSVLLHLPVKTEIRRLVCYHRELRLPTISRMSVSLLCD